MSSRWLVWFGVAIASVAACSSGAIPAAGVGGRGGGGGAAGSSIDGGFDAPAGTGGKVDAGSGGTGGGAPPVDPWRVLVPPKDRKLDILFMVDNSQSMLPLQAKLLAGFSAFTDRLKQLPLGLPDLHLAVISSDTGPGRYDLPDRHCAFQGDQGRFQVAPRGICAASPLTTAPGSAAFLAASMNQTVKNYTGDINDAFTCIAALGDQGCGFEGQLKSVRWALDPINLPFENVGFLRRDATLAVILVTNEDDCSVPDDSDLADPTQITVSSPLGPLWSFRCNEFGHLCNINGTLQPPSRTVAMSNLQGCVSNESPTSKLTRVGDEIAFLKSLKSDPNQLVVAAITGPPQPYSTELIQTATDVEPHGNIVHSCTQATGEFADPAVRIAQWLAAFGANGTLQTICANSLAAPLQQIAGKIATLLEDSVCVSGPFPVAPPDGGAPSPPASCRVVDRTLRSDGSQQNTLLPGCAAGGVRPCWVLTNDVAGCLDGKRLAVDRGGVAPGAGVTTLYNCTPCAPGSTELGCP